MSSITCPLCGGNMIYKKCNSTHIWKCQDCPAILFEYYGIKDIKNLKRELGPECKHEKLTEIHVVVIEGVLNRELVVCENCGKIIKTKEYAV